MIIVDMMASLPTTPDANRSLDLREQKNELPKKALSGEQRLVAPKNCLKQLNLQLVTKVISNRNNSLPNFEERIR